MKLPIKETFDLIRGTHAPGKLLDHPGGQACNCSSPAAVIDRLDHYRERNQPVSILKLTTRGRLTLSMEIITPEQLTA